MASVEDLEIPTLNALASAPAGTMTMADLSSHLEARHGSTDEAADDARSAHSITFQDTVRQLLDGLASRGLIEGNSAGGLFTVTPEGRASIGR